MILKRLDPLTPFLGCQATGHHLNGVRLEAGTQRLTHGFRCCDEAAEDDRAGSPSPSDLRFTRTSGLVVVVPQMESVAFCGFGARGSSEVRMPQWLDAHGEAILGSQQFTARAARFGCRPWLSRSRPPESPPSSARSGHAAFGIADRSRSWPSVGGSGMSAIRQPSLDADVSR